MLKHIFVLIVAALIALGTAGNARAAFADLELIRVYYDRGGNEYGTDLGNVENLTAGGAGATIAGTFGSLAANSSFAVYFALDRNTGHLWASNSIATAPLINGTSLGIATLKSGTTNMYSLYNSMGGTTYFGSASAASSYLKKISATQGNLANAINNIYRMGTEASLASVIGTSNGSVTQILYYWPNGNTNTLSEKTGIPVAFITTKADGSTVVSPPPPSTPTGVSVSALDAQATVYFSAPDSDGGAPITGYTVTSNPDGLTVSGAASPITVTGLTNGTAYTFSVTATTANGTGPAAVTASVTPAAAAAPTAPEAITGSASTIAETSATLNGTVSANGASTTVAFAWGTDLSYGSTTAAGQSPLAADSAAGSAVSAAVSGLACNTTYHYRVAATNSAGSGTGSDQSFTTAPCVQAEQSISFVPAASATYGDTVELTASATSGLPVGFSVVSGPGSLSGNSLTFSGAGTVVVQASQPGNQSYLAAADVPASITVAPKALTITANDANRTYGAANPASPGFSASGLVGTDSISGVSYVYASTATATAPVGSTHAVTPSAAVFAAGSADNYSISYANGTLTVAFKAAQSVTFAPPAGKTYGDAPIALSASATSGLPVGFSVVSGPASLSGSTLTFTGAGTVVVKATQGGDSNYLAATEVSGSIAVAPRAVTVKANDASRPYGAENPADPGFTATGLAGSDAISGMTYSYAATATAAAASGSTHAITPSTALFSTGSAGNYSITYADGTLTVAGNAPQTISFSPVASATYGDAPFALSATATSGLPVGFAVTAGPATVSGGTLAITGAGTVTVKAYQAGDASYAAAPEVTATITVARKAVSVTANDVGRAYGAANPVNPGFTSTGLAGGDSIGSVSYSYAATATPTAPVGSTHAITPSAPLFAAGSADNYSISYLPGTLTVNTKAAQSIGTLGFSPAALSAGGTSSVSAAASSGLAVSFASATPLICSVSGSQVSAIAVGTCIVTAGQPGDGNYLAALQATGSITVGRATQSIDAITLPPATLTVGGNSTASATASSGLAVSFSSLTPSVCTVSGNTVTGVSAGSCSIAADQAGNASYSPATQLRKTVTVSATIPGAPILVSASAGNERATVTFAAPLSNGGSPITGYTVTTIPAGGTDSGAGTTSLSHLVTGLVNGTSYTFVVTAANALGTGTASAPSSPVIPMGTPGAPTGVSAVAGNGEATVSFTAPTSDGGSPVTGYTVTASPGGMSWTGSASPVTVSGLTNGTAYTFQVAAVNALGSGTASAPSNSVTPSYPPISFTVTPAAGANGAIAPATAQLVEAGRNLRFTVTPAAGYQIASVTGCGGTLAGNAYTTAGASANCTVSASFIAIPSLKGDLDGDGQIGIADALLALQYAAGLKVRTPAVIAAGDVAPIVGGASAPDGKLDIGDAVALLRRSVGQLSW